MKRTIWRLALPVALVSFVAACGKSADPAATASGGSAPDPAARQAEWTWLEETKAALDLQRAELASLQDQAALGAEVGAQLEPLVRAITTQGDEFGRRLAAYINADPPTPGQPPKPEQLAAVRLKSADDIQVAREHIRQTGDYEKAIAILNRAVALDPDSTELKAALDDARATRFMTAERFASVIKGMGAAEVIKLLGRPSQNHVRPFPETRVVLWTYPKNDAGEAAGVYFNEKRTVYALDFDAVKKSDGSTAPAPAV